MGKKNPAAWYRTIDKVNEALYRQPKPYIPDIKNPLFPVLDQGETYSDHNLYFLIYRALAWEVLGGAAKRRRYVLRGVLQRAHGKGAANPAQRSGVLNPPQAAVLRHAFPAIWLPLRRPPRPSAAFFTFDHRVS